MNSSLSTSSHPSSKLTQTLATKWILHLSSPCNWCHPSSRQNHPSAELHGVGARRLRGCRMFVCVFAQWDADVHTYTHAGTVQTRWAVARACFIHGHRPPFRSSGPQLAPAQTSQAGRGRLPFRKCDAAPAEPTEPARTRAHKTLVPLLTFTQHTLRATTTVCAANAHIYFGGKELYISCNTYYRQICTFAKQCRLKYIFF